MRGGSISAKWPVWTLPKYSVTGTCVPILWWELKSHWDRLPTLREKMGTWIANGAELAWLIDAEARTVEIYRSGQAPEVRKDIGFIDGEGPFAGFHLPLESIWNPLPGKVAR